MTGNLLFKNSFEVQTVLDKLSQAEKDIYFKPEFYDLYQKNNEGEPNCFVFEKGAKAAIYPFLINTVNDLGYDLDNKYFDIQGAYGYNGIITNSYDTAFIEAFYVAFNEFCSKNNIIAEFTRFHPMLENSRFSSGNMKVLLDRETVLLDLDQSYVTIWEKEYSSNNRNMIRKAQKNGYTSICIQFPSVSQIDEFIDIYCRTMIVAAADAYFFFSRDFFYNMFKYLKDYTYLINILNRENEVVCTSIFFKYGSYFHYHLSGRTAVADNTVNNYLLDEAVKFAQEKGAKKFHFGGGRSNAPDDSLLKFKSNFSKKRLPFFIGKKVHHTEVYAEVVKQWEIKNPHKKDVYKNYLLKYRY